MFIGVKCDFAQGGDNYFHPFDLYPSHTDITNTIPAAARNSMPTVIDPNINIIKNINNLP